MALLLFPKSHGQWNDFSTSMTKEISSPTSRPPTPLNFAVTISRSFPQVAPLPEIFNMHIIIIPHTTIFRARPAIKPSISSTMTPTHKIINFRETGREYPQYAYIRRGSPNKHNTPHRPRKRSAVTAAHGDGDGWADMDMYEGVLGDRSGDVV